MGRECEVLVNLLILANHYPVASGRYVAEAARRLGHTVYTDGPAQGGVMWGLHFPTRFHWTPEPAPADAPLDLVIVMDSDPALLNASREYAGRAPVVVFGVDNHVRSYRREWISRYYLGHSAPSLMPWERDMTWLPCAYDPTVFTPSAIPWAERKWDVAMLGVMYPARRAAVEELRAAGLKVIAGTGLIGKACADVYQNSRVSLCLSAAGDVGQRVFETAAAGCVVFSDNCADFQHLRPLGVAVWDGNNLVDSMQSILADAETAQTMAAMSTAWATPETWDARLTRLLELEAL